MQFSKQLLIYFYLLLFSNLTALELNRVILSTNNNPDYIQFWPIVAPLWKEMGLEPTLALIADENCPIDTSIGDVIRFSPIQGVPQSLQAQTIRHLLPTLFPDDGCLISDIDMIPISRSYFYEGALLCPEDAFLIYRDNAYDINEKKYPMCYFAAKGSTFTSVFGVSTPSEIEKLIREWSSKGFGWNTDEILLYDYVNQWEKLGNEVARLGHNVGPRLDRLYWNSQLTTLKNELPQWIDCHFPRPYSAHKLSIDYVVQEIKRQWREEPYFSPQLSSNINAPEIDEVLKNRMILCTGPSLRRKEMLISSTEKDMDKITFKKIFLTTNDPNLLDVTFKGQKPITELLEEKGKQLDCLNCIISNINNVANDPECDDEDIIIFKHESVFINDMHLVKQAIGKILSGYDMVVKRYICPKTRPGSPELHRMDHTDSFYLKVSSARKFLRDHPYVTHFTSEYQFCEEYFTKYFTKLLPNVFRTDYSHCSWKANELGFYHIPACETDPKLYIFWDKKNYNALYK